MPAEKTTAQPLSRGPTIFVCLPSILDTSATIKIGTCAWTFDDWRGVFYPEHLPAAERLAFYARYMPGVEVDSTFYGAPRRSVVEHWAEVTPDDFAFACKMPKAITHELRLRDAVEPLNDFLAAIEPLGKKLWSVIAQLPPSFRLERDESALRAFIHQLPPKVRFAFEFRHADWHLPRIAHLLEEHRIAWVWNDLTPLDHQREGAFEFLPDPTDFLYVRLMGDLDKKYHEAGKTIHRYTRLQWPREVALESWAVRLRQAAADHRRVFIAVNNHFEGYAPHTAQRLAERMGFFLQMPNLAAVDEHGTDDGQLDLL